jgi:hypothetical protein
MPRARRVGRLLSLHRAACLGPLCCLRQVLATILDPLLLNRVLPSRVPRPFFFSLREQTRSVEDTARIPPSCLSPLCVSLTLEGSRCIPLT